MGVQLSGAGSGAAAAPAADAGTLPGGTEDSGCMWIGVRANGLLPLLGNTAQHMSLLVWQSSGTVCVQLCAKCQVIRASTSCTCVRWCGRAARPE